MAKTIVDMDAAFLSAQALAGEWEEEFMLEWTGPLIMAETVQMFLSLPPESRAELQASDPELYKELNNQVALMKRRLGRTGGSYA